MSALYSFANVLYTDKYLRTNSLHRSFVIIITVLPFLFWWVKLFFLFLYVDDYMLMIIVVYNPCRITYILSINYNLNIIRVETQSTTLNVLELLLFIGIKLIIWHRYLWPYWRQLKSSRTIGINFWPSISDAIKRFNGWNPIIKS